jgi:hypothetical protein
VQETTAKSMLFIGVWHVLLVADTTTYVRWDLVPAVLLD